VTEVAFHIPTLGSPLLLSPHATKQNITTNTKTINKPFFNADIAPPLSNAFARKPQLMATQAYTLNEKCVPLLCGLLFDYLNLLTIV